MMSALGRSPADSRMIRLHASMETVIYEMIRFQPKSPWNKGKLVGQKLPLKPKGNLGHPDQTGARQQDPRTRAIQPGD